MLQNFGEWFKALASVPPLVRASLFSARLRGEKTRDMSGWKFPILRLRIPSSVIALSRDDWSGKELQEQNRNANLFKFGVIRFVSCAYNSENCPESE
jgi:hypothetical protein